MKLKNNKLIYITYQVFPSSKANSLQTIRMLENFKKQRLEVSLFFPNRGKFSKEKKIIEDFYNIEQTFEIESLKHYLPFNALPFFNKFNFLISSFIWSLYAFWKLSPKIASSDLLMTRTHWVLLFFSHKTNLIVYECHKYSKIENLIFKFIKNKSKIILIFTNELLKKQYKLSDNLNSNSLILESSFDEKYFSKKYPNKIINRVVFAGNLLRFNKSRNLDFLLNAFDSPELSEYELFIIGGPDQEYKKFSDFKSKNIFFLGPLSNKNTINEMRKAEIGILINSPDNHSKFFTSPIKYFEYLRSDLKIVAIDFPSHRNLPFLENIYFYNNSDKFSFINAIKTASSNEFKIIKDLNSFSYESRVKKILKVSARLEGLEPPTL